MPPGTRASSWRSSDKRPYEPESTKDQLREFLRGEPGQRFQRRHERRRRAQHGQLRRGVLLACGSAVLLGGVVLMPAPGPGVLIVLAGACMLADESLRVARLLDRSELALRRLYARLRRRR